jgi:adenosine kinase
MAILIYFLLLSKIYSIMDPEKNIAIIGFGSPIVDAVLNYDDNPELSEQIKKTFNYHMDKDFPVEFYNQVLNAPEVRTFLGGSAMNTIRLVKNLLKQEEVMYVGSIGKDQNGNFISKSLEKEGVIFQKEMIDKYNTSTVIVLVHDTDRAFYSDLASSNKISLEHFTGLYKEIQNSRVFYADAYILGTRKDIFNYVYKTHYQDNTILSIGLASEHIVRDNCESLLSLMPYFDLIFCNKIEIETFKNCLNKSHMDNFDFLKELMQMDKMNKNKQRVIVMTQSTEDTIIAVNNFNDTNDVELITVPVNAIEKAHIVDTNGAGDAFSAGFLAGYLEGYSYTEAAMIGNYIAGKVIKLKGFQIPEVTIEEALHGKNRLEL